MPPKNLPIIWRKQVKAKRVAQPLREFRRVKAALDLLHIRYWDTVGIRNPHLVRRGGQKGGEQWLDFVIQVKGFGAGVLLFPAKYIGSGATPLQIEYLKAKQRRLDERGVPYLMLDRRKSQAEYAVEITRWILNLQRRGRRSRATLVL